MPEESLSSANSIAWSPDDLFPGTFTSLRHLNARDQKKLLESDVFRLSHDDWMAAPGKVQWSEGQGQYLAI